MKGAQVPERSAPVMFTRTEDIATFATASLDLKKWPKESTMAGHTKSYNQVVEIAEKTLDKPPATIRSFWTA